MEISDELQLNGMGFGQLVEQIVLLPHQVEVLLPWLILSGLTAEAFFGVLCSLSQVM